MSNTILVVEDEKLLLADMCDILTFEGYEVLEAADGEAGLALARENTPDLIISDIMMPKMDGYELILQLQQDAKTATIPILLLTAKSSRVDIRKGMQLGADDYLTKPVNHEDLLMAIQSRLEKKKRETQLYQRQIEQLRTSITRSLPHEMRTPLNAILGYTSFLLEDKYSFDNDKVYKLIDIVHQAGKRLERLVENYLTYAHVEMLRANPDLLKEVRERYTNNPAYPSAYIEEIAINLAKKFNREDDLITQLDNIPVQSSEQDCGKVVSELVDNAFRYSASGTSVTVTLRVLDDHSALVVKDEGRGMSVEQIRSIDAFVQFERQVYEQQGVGLGLTVAKGLTEIYGGLLTINSKIQKGTSIHVQYPVQGLEKRNE